MPNPIKQKGTAIVVALFVVALVTIAAMAMITRLQQDMRRTELQLNSNQAFLYAQGSTAWAIDQLNNDWKQKQPNQIVDKTPIQSSSNKMGPFTITSTIYDAQGFFNLNNLTDEKFRDNFSHLIHVVAPEISVNDLKNITLATVDWISPASPRKFDTEYAKLTPPYRAPHRPMTSVSELRLVKGVTSKLFARLSPYVTALPIPTKINVNNAPAPVLMSLDPTLSAESAKAIEKYSQQTPSANKEAFLKIDIVKNNHFQEEKIEIPSSYFLLKTEVNIGEQNTILYTLLERSVKDTQPNVNIIWQSKGTL